MSDEPTAVAEAPESTPTPPAAPPETDAAFDGWIGGLRERAQTRPGAAAAQDDDAEAEGAPRARAKPAAPAAEKPKAAEGDDPPAPAVDLNAEFRRRRERRAGSEVERLAAENRELLAIIQEAMEGGGPEAAPRRHTEDDDADEPDFAQDPKAWHQWNYRQLQAAIHQKVDPLLAERQAKARAQAKSAEQNELTSALQAELQAAQTEYLETPEGQGYEERFNAFHETLRSGLVEDLGLPEPVAQSLVLGELQGMISLAYQLGEHPIAFSDKMLRIYGRVAAAVEAGVGGAPRAPAARPTPATARAQREIRGLRAAAAAPEAGSVSEGGSVSAKGERNLTQRLQKGEVTAADLREHLQQTGGLSKNRLFDLMAAADRDGRTR